ncbi:MAG TPA: oligoendopeptidase F [Clostridia bacterium]|nr:oligoendopeptidase F [Clostridia bacterium]
MDNTVLSREQIPEQYKWKLEDIFASDKQWEDEFAALKANYAKLGEYKGRLNNKQDILAALKLYYEFELSITRLFVYARMRRDEDNSNPLYQAMTDRATMLSVEMNTEFSFMTPEITKLSNEELEAYSIDPDLYDYRRYFISIIRNKEHILSDSEERLLALMGDMADACDSIFTMLNDADMRFPVIKDADGNDVEITHGRYRALLESQDRRVRRDAFQGLYSSYKSHINTLASIYSGSIKTDVFFSRARKYPSSLEAALHSDYVPVSVYNELINSINRSLPVLHRYVELRKKLLGMDEMHMYDMYVPLISSVNKKISYEEACDMIKKALAPLGAEYQALLDEAYKNNWIDVYETRGKTSGAYSWGVYGVHPYVLLNFQGELDDMFTIAHELGHALHSYKSNKAQPFTTAGYKILVAEVASTVNEVLLLKYLLANTDNKDEKLYLLNHFLEQFRTTVFRQTMFAEYEKLTHEMSERSEALTHEVLSDKYMELNRKYYGDSVVSDAEITLEWSRIPHFYRAFYVYKYATGFSSAVAIAEKILKTGQTAVDDYMKFLSAGGSMDALDILRITGVDLTTPEPVNQCMKLFAETLDEFERTVNEK